jgi:hypothetical protein
MKQRTIIIPKTKKAELALDFDKAKNSDLFIYALSEKDFLLLFKSAFVELNKSLGIIIDDFEDEKISIDKVNEAKKVIDNLKYKTNDIYLIELLTKLNSFFELANQCGTGIYFYF